MILNTIPKTFTQIAIRLINAKHEIKKKRNIWNACEWKNINDLENDDVGGVGEEIINIYCKEASISSDINGKKTKQLGGGAGDGKINGRTCEIKTARMGSDGSSFQHELGEVPWKAEFMIFLDISPANIFITIFPNFSQEVYIKAGTESNNKCDP